MARAVWKIPYVPRIFASKSFSEKTMFFTKKRRFLISKKLVNKRFKIHNGIWMLSLTVKPEMIGHKLGEFSLTKRLGREIHLNGKSKKNKKR